MGLEGRKIVMVLGPANLRKHTEPVDFVKRFFQTGKTVAAICHGPQMLASAGLLRGWLIALKQACGRFWYNPGKACNAN